MGMISTELLRRFPFFTGVGEETLRELAMAGREASFRPGDVLFREGDPADDLWVLVHGEADLSFVLADGDRKTVDTIVGGDLMVWSAVVPPHRIHLEGVARTELRVILFRADRVRELMEKDAELGYRLMSAIALALSHRLQGAQIQLATRAG